MVRVDDAGSVTTCWLVREEIGYIGTGFVLSTGIRTLLRAANGGSVDVTNVVDVVGRVTGTLPL